MGIGTRFRQWRAGWSIGLALISICFAGLPVKASAYDTQPQRAARLSYLRGSVTVDRMDNTGSDPAVVNMPLATGVRVSTGEDGQAEIEFEDGSLIRLTPNSALNLNALTVDPDGSFQTDLALVHGLAYAELRATQKFQYTIDADGDRISPVANATLRITLDQPPAMISMLDGAARVDRADSQEAAGYQTDVRSGETLTPDSTDASRYFISQQIAPDSWDQWNQDRDQAAADEAANQTAARNSYAGDQGYGWSDLDANGTWYDVPEQGRVWQPAVAVDADFDPYGYGNWVYYPGVGYVWASGYGWGWTPFRCGSWSYWNGFGWGWLPGNGCGFGGWGFGGGSYVINIISPPQNYVFVHRPVVVSGPGHPIHIGRPVRPVQPPERTFQGTRTIAGQQVVPLRPIGGANPTREPNTVGSALRRDYPVDRNSHQPIAGVVATPTNTNPGPDGRFGMPRPANPNGGDRNPVSHREPGASTLTPAPSRQPPPVSHREPGGPQRIPPPSQQPAPRSAPAPPSAPRPAPGPAAPAAQIKSK